MSWDVLWLVAGGIALGLAMEKTGLAQHAVDSIPFNTFTPIAIVAMTAILAAVMANFMSNTATANLLLPVIAALGVTLPSLAAIGGAKALILSVTLSSSLGMALPISTPPNALAHATGEIPTNQMSKVGIYLGLIGLMLIFLLIFVLNLIGFV